MGTLAAEVKPGVYVPRHPGSYGPNAVNQDEFRDAAIAQVAGLHIGELAMLNAQHENSLHIGHMTLPTPVRGEKVQVFRGGYHYDPQGLHAPRGGTRLYQALPHIKPDGEVHDLSDGMDTKFALNMPVLIQRGIVDPRVEVPVGGKTEIVTPIDPREYTPGEKQQIIEETARVLAERGYFTEYNHRTGPDVNMKPADMAVIRDTLAAYGYGREQADSWITGKPKGDGGVAGRKEATARGAAVALDEYLRLLGVPEKTVVRFSIQGFGNAGGPLLQQFKEVSKDYYGLLTCVSDETGTIIAPSGISPSILRDFLYEQSEAEDRYVGVYEAGLAYGANLPQTKVKVISRQEDPDAWLKAEADCYVPAALASGINPGNVDILTKKMQANPDKCLFVWPLANHGVSSLAQLSLERAGIRTGHHAHINGYGVVASLAESAMAGGRFTKNAAKKSGPVNELIDSVARDTTRRIFELSRNLEMGVLASMALTVEAMRYMNLAERYSKVDMSRG